MGARASEIYMTFGAEYWDYAGYNGFDVQKVRKAGWTGSQPRKTLRSGSMIHL